jgi:hypothetical protein
MTKTRSYVLNEKVYNVKSIYMGDLVRLVLVGETSEKFLNCFYNCEMPYILSINEKELRTFGDCYMNLVHPREMLNFIEDIHDELKATGLTNRNVGDVCAVVEDCVKQKILIDL